MSSGRPDRPTTDTNVDKTVSSLVADLQSQNTSNEQSLSSELVVDQVQQLIDTLERYHQKRMKKTVCLSEIQSIVKKLVLESESLSKVSKQLSATDRLRSIVNQSLILSSAEIVKFNSGFYKKG